MTLILFVRSNCHDCDVVTGWMDAAKIPYRIADIDRERTPEGVRLFVGPALCVNGRLEAYGVDIIPRLRELGFGQ
jgi:hypothetical protein